MNNEKDGKDISPEADDSPQLSLDENNKIVYFGSFSQNTRNTAKASSPESIIDKERNRRRRSSLQTKLDRRRNRISIEDALKTSLTMDTQNEDQLSENYTRQKRHSWWNIFVPEQLRDRTRRASQDITNVPVTTTSGNSNSNLTSKISRRSKSHSVDHGRSSFGSHSLRFKSAERFTTTRSSLPSIATKSYTVGNRDTLTSVAASFDTTPTELTQLNRLSSSFIFPGQILLVPIKEAKSDSSIDETPSDEKLMESPETPVTSSSIIVEHESKFQEDIYEGLRTSSPKPGRIERVTVTKNYNENDPVIAQRFLKINVRHITDGQGVVGGVLLVTPNAIMFDPNVSDTLVIEHGADNYGVIAPMELVVNIAIFYDIAHMRISGDGENNKTINADIYHPKTTLNETEEVDEKEGEKIMEIKQSVDEESTTTDKISLENESTASEVYDDGPKEENELDHNCTTTEQQKSDVIEKTEGEKKDSCENDSKELNSTTGTDSMLEERRQSLLDHHWAIPNRDESDGVSNKNVESFAQNRVDVSAEASPIVGVDLSSQTCYDSGIDIRDSIPNIQPIPKKVVYSDADIVLSSEWVPPRTIPSANLKNIMPISSIITDIGENSRKKTTSVSFSMDDNEQQSKQQQQSTPFQTDKSSEKKSRMLKRLSYPFLLSGDNSNSSSLTGINAIGKSSDGDLASSSNSNNDSSNQSVFSKVFSRRSSISTFIRPHSSSESNQQQQQTLNKPVKEKIQPPKLDYRSMVSIDDKPELFISVDRLIPRPASTCDDPPLYLRLRMGKPLGKTVHLPNSVMSYGKNYLRSEYWFSVPKNRVDELYRFVNAWMSHLYGELNEEKIRERGFELIQGNIEWSESHFGCGGGKNSNNKSIITEEEGEEKSVPSRDSWEVVSLNLDESKKLPSYGDLEFFIPELIGKTEILNEEHREKLCKHLPARAEGYPWTLVFSTSQHGFSLNSLYRKMQRLESPILIVIQDTDNNVFGALTSCAIHVSDHFYGTGESILYKFNPTFKVFHWTGENLYFTKGNIDSLSIGAGNGRFGLWLDGDLNQGRSQTCCTYSNEPLAPQEDFVIKTMECWAFK